MNPDTILMYRMPDGKVLMVSGWARELTVQTAPYERGEMQLDLVVDQTFWRAEDASRVWQDINRPKELPVKREQLGE